MRLGPVRGVTIDVSLTQEKPVDPQLGHFDLLGSSDMCANQIPDGLLFLVGNMNGCEQSAAVEFDQVDRIPAIGFLPITSTSGDQGRGDDLAGEAIVLQRPMDDKATAGGFVTYPHRTPFRKSADEFAELVEIGSQTSDLGIGSLILEHGSGDRVLVDIESNPDNRWHGWTSCAVTHVVICGSDRTARPPSQPTIPTGGQPFHMVYSAWLLVRMRIPTTWRAVFSSRTPHPA